jgi:hypothetical protein
MDQVLLSEPCFPWKKGLLHQYDKKIPKYATEKKERKSIGLQVDFFKKKAPHREAYLR